jgi:NADH-quinone oxidoreductase subunit L
MNWIVEYLWLIPVLPLLAAAAISIMPRSIRKPSAALAIGAMGASFLLSAKALLTTLAVNPTGKAWHWTYNFEWFQFGSASMRLGWVLDPLTVVMLVMVTFVALLIFIFSVGYMSHDENFTRFFCFLSLFAAAMLGLIIANNLLMLFMCWELVGLASYLLIGFWFHKPSAAAASKKAFITTRVGDVIFFLGILFLYWQAGTLLFYDGNKGFLEAPVLTELAGRTTSGGMAVTTAIGLLIFCGAIGKSGQFPLHVWLPDAMEGPTPVSALIHAATMVAAGVFLIARIFPLLDPHVIGVAGSSAALNVVTWVGAITAVFAACIAVAQNDIKRILAYSTVSQLGFMMMGLGAGGVAVGMFHLITHAFFKALLFLGSGSVIHGCHEEQDIRKMGGLKKYMPATFITYGIGMMALAGVPLVFSGFWSKDGILHAAGEWNGYGSKGPFYLGAFAALLTAFYMTRQMIYVFFGNNRAGKHQEHGHAHTHGHDSTDHHDNAPHESPAVMTVPLMILAVFAIGLGFLGTPAWPWFQNFLEGKTAEFNLSEIFSPEIRPVLILSSIITLLGISLGWWVYGRTPITDSHAKDALEKSRPDIFTLLQNKFYVDEFYETTIIRFNAWFAGFCDLMDFWVWNGAVMAVSYVIVGISWASRFLDEYGINLGFDKSCSNLSSGGGFISKFQNGQAQKYFRVVGIALALLGLMMLWGCKTS